MENLTLRVHIEIYQPSTSGRLNLSSETELEAKDFMDVCSVPAKFQELADTLKMKRK